MRPRRDQGTVWTSRRIGTFPPGGGPDLPDQPDDEPTDDQPTDDQPTDDQPTDKQGADTPRDQRRYVITAERFHCGDESMSDWWGSDEVVWAFTTKLEGEGNQKHKTQRYGDVDSGETKYFRTGDGEIAPPEGSLADGVAAPMGASIQLIDQDAGKDVGKLVKSAFEGAKLIPTVGEWVRMVPDEVINEIVERFGDDVMGSNTIVFRARNLEGRLPYIGNSFVDKYYFGGKETDLPITIAGGPDYYLYVKVTRVDDAT